MTRVFLSYRRADGGMAAGRLAGDLADRLGPGQVVRDVDSIKPGANFVETLHRELATCDALVALTGHHWLGGPESGGRRLDDPDDWVRIEIATALGRGIPVVPVLLDGARMPTPDLLPVELKPLTAIQAIQMSDAYWNPALANLLEALGEGPGFRWDRLRRSSRRWAARLTTMSRPVALSLAALTLLAAAVGIALGFWWFDPRSLRCWPPYGLAGPAAYESRTEIIPMAKDWSSAGAATRWALHSIGCRPTEDALYAMFVPALVNETVGMLDSSMRQLAAALKQHGLRAASARSVTFDDVASRAGQQPIVVFGARWGHHVGVRRTSASGDLELANPASGVPGNAAWSQQTLSREDFARLGPFSALWIEASPRPIPTPTPTPRRL